MRFFRLLLRIITLWLSCAKDDLEYWWLKTRLITFVKIRIRVRFAIYRLTGF